TVPPDEAGEPTYPVPPCQAPPGRPATPAVCGNGYQWAMFFNRNGSFRDNQGNSDVRQYCSPASMMGLRGNDNLVRSPAGLLFALRDVNGDHIADIVTAS